MSRPFFMYDDVITKFRIFLVTFPIIQLLFFSCLKMKCALQFTAHKNQHFVFIFHAFHMFSDYYLTTTSNANSQVSHSSSP